MTPSETLAALDAGTLEPASFGHREHVLAAWEALRQDEFFAAAARYASGLRGLAARAGVPEKYSATVTLAFLSLIAERMQGETGDAEAFLAANTDLMRGDALAARYSPERLAAPNARRIALLPDRAP